MKHALPPLPSPMQYVVLCSIWEHNSKAGMSIASIREQVKKSGYLMSSKERIYECVEELENKDLVECVYTENGSRKYVRMTDYGCKVAESLKMLQRVYRK